jgi:DNA-binding MarR family transcriptional regulator
MHRSSATELSQEAYVVDLLRAARQLEIEGERFFSSRGLTGAQFNILNLMGNRGALPQAQLSDELIVGKASISSVMGNLLKRSLISLTADEHDRRANIASLTSSGVRLWKEVRSAYLAELKVLLSAVSEKEVAILRKGLEPVRALQLQRTSDP